MEHSLLSLGNDAFDEGRFDEAIWHYQGSIELENHKDEALMNLASSYFEVKKYQEAINIADRLLTNNDSLYIFELLFVRGNCYQWMKEFKKAENDFSRAIDLIPIEPSAYFNRANAREKLNDAAGAESDRKMVDFLENEDRDDANFSAPKEDDIDDYTLDQFNHDKSVLLADIALRPNSYSLYFELGNAYAKLRVLDKAIEYFQKAIELYPEEFYSQAHQNIIAANMDQDNFHKVIELADDYLKHDPKSKVINEVIYRALEEINNKK